jgi:hypothetical protein
MLSTQPNYRIRSFIQCQIDIISLQKSEIYRSNSHCGSRRLLYHPRFCNKSTFTIVGTRIIYTVNSTQFRQNIRGKIQTLWPLETDNTLWTRTNFLALLLDGKKPSFSMPSTEREENFKNESADDNIPTRQSSALNLIHIYAACVVYNFVITVTINTIRRQSITRKMRLHVACDFQI